MQKGRSFEKQIEKVIEYIEKLGFHGHKNYAKRTAEGLYLEGECFDYEIFLPNRHDCFDAKQCNTDTWHIVKKDVRQVNELKKCKNAGCNAYFLICFENKDVRMIDVDLVIEYLKQNKKSIKKIRITKLGLNKRNRTKGVTMEQDINKLIQELTNVRPNELSTEGLKLFNKINEIIDKNKELKEEKKDLKDKLNSSRKANEKLSEKNRNLQIEKETAYSEAINNIIAGVDLDNSFIPVSLVEEKIEEYKKRIEKYYEYKEQGKETDVEFYENITNIEIVRILQELLEKRK